jgi:hypothetical protein
MSQNFCLLQQFSEDCPKEVIAQLPKIRPIGKYSLNRRKFAQSAEIRPIVKKFGPSGPPASLATPFSPIP